MRDITLQSIVDWLIPDFKERDDKLKAQLLKQINEKRMQKGTLKPGANSKKKSTTTLPIKGDGSEQ